MGTVRAEDVLGGGWVTAFFIIVLAVLGWINNTSPRKWRLIWQTFLRLRLGRQTMREDINMQDRTLVALLLVAVALIGLFAWQFGVVRGAFGDDEAAGGFFRFAEMCGIVLLVVALQLVVVRAASSLFQVDGGALEYYHTIVLMLIMLGLVLLPVTLLAAYREGWRPVVLIAGGMAVLAMLIYRWVRALAIGLGQGSSPGYIVLYLCAAEFLPAAIALRSLQHVLYNDVQPH